MSAPKLPDGLPPLPEGAVYLPYPDIGRGSFHGWSLLEEDGEWELGEWYGTNKSLYYAAPAGSAIALMNGHVFEQTNIGEAVALVRKLHEQLSKRLDGDEWVWRDAMAVRTEAESFLKREENK